MTPVRMPPSHPGSLQELQDTLLPLDLDGEWEELANGVHKFRCRDRAGHNWSETKGTIWFDGPVGPKEALAAKVEGLVSVDEPVAVALPGAGKIFVVHGHDHNARDQLELVLRRLGLAPYVLQVTGGGGDTLIEALERMIGRAAQSSFGIVLATPDDLGYLKTDGPEESKARARQNVTRLSPCRTSI